MAFKVSDFLLRDNTNVMDNLIMWSGY